MASLPPLLNSCSPRPREQTSSDYAADLHKALQGEIGNAASALDFFAGTHVTPAMRRVATGVFDRLKHGTAANQSAIIRFNSMFGGGKTHTLISLAAAAKHPGVGALWIYRRTDAVRSGRGRGESGLFPPEKTRTSSTVWQWMALASGPSHCLVSSPTTWGGTPPSVFTRNTMRCSSDPGAEDIQHLIGTGPR